MTNIKKKFSLIIIDYHNSGVFFLREIKKAKELNLNTDYIILTNLVSIYLMAKKQNITCHIINVFSVIKRNKTDYDITSVREYLSGSLSLKQTINLLNKWEKSISMVFDRYQKIESVFLWNGQSISGVALNSYFGRSRLSLRRYFCEISNLHGKLLVDRMGVGKSSEFFSGDPLVNYDEPSEDEFQKWRSNYISQKLEVKGDIVKQAVNQKKLQFRHFYDSFFLAILGYSYSFSFYKVKTKNKISSIFQTKYKNVTDWNINEPFVLVPLQVSSDTNLLINSSYDNEKLLNYVIGKYDKKKLIVKLHPAEDNSQFLKGLIRKFSKFDNIIFTSNNLYELISNAKAVVTINSTVGLESIIFGKKVEILGFAPYKNFDRNDLKTYILRHLINVDFFSSKGDSLFQQVALRYES